MSHHYPGQYWMPDWQPDSVVGQQPQQDEEQPSALHRVPGLTHQALPQERELLMRQAPIQARASSHRAKGRKPVDPPPVVQLVDRRHAGQSGVYDNPYIFMLSSLVAEDYDGRLRGPVLPSNYLIGPRTSSIYRLRDTLSEEGGFFVFGDLSVRHEGRFRLRFTLFERETDGEGQLGHRFVTELISNVFTVYSPKTFPGMMESTELTRLFSDQGVKLRLRKEPRPIPSRGQKRQADTSITDSSEPVQKKQTPLMRSPTNLRPAWVTEAQVSSPQNQANISTVWNATASAQDGRVSELPDHSSIGFMYEFGQHPFYQNLPQ